MPLPQHNNHLRMCWVKFSKKLSFSESLHSACSLLVSFFLFLRFFFGLSKRLVAPRMFPFSLLFSELLLFVTIQKHFSVRANAFWTASFFPFQAGCHCYCLWAGCIYLGVIGVWMSEVMRCIHTWLLCSPRTLRQTQPSWALAWAVPHCCLLDTSQNLSSVARWTVTGGVVWAFLSVHGKKEQRLLVCFWNVGMC